MSFILVIQSCDVQINNAFFSSFRSQIVFKSANAGGCTRFSADIFESGKTTCLNNAPHMATDTNDEKPKPEDRSLDRSQEEMELSPRELDPNGYK